MAAQIPHFGFKVVSCYKQKSIPREIVEIFVVGQIGDSPRQDEPLFRFLKLRIQFFEMIPRNIILQNLVDKIAKALGLGVFHVETVFPMLPAFNQPLASDY